jgi:antitoxin MazE
MTTTVQKWGNSLALRIPSSVAKDVRLRQGSVVDVAIVEGRMVVKPKGRQKYSLGRMLKGVKKRNLHTEHLAGNPKGREAW